MYNKKINVMTMCTTKPGVFYEKSDYCSYSFGLCHASTGDVQVYSEWFGDIFRQALC